MSTWNLASVLLQERRDVERPKAKGEVAAGRGAQMGSRWAGAGAVMGRQALLQGLALGGRRGGLLLTWHVLGPHARRGGGSLDGRAH